MTSVIRPYADLDGIFARVEYRSALNQPFAQVDLSNGSASQLVRVDDLRTIPQHQLRVELEPSVLKPYYERHRAALRLVVLTRDATLRREVKLLDENIDDAPDPISIDRSALRVTGLRDRLTFEIAIVVGAILKGDYALPAQKGSRLAQVEIALRNTAGGASFPFKRASADDIKKLGRPPESGIHLVLKGDPQELITDSDTPIANLLEIWIHEKIWAAIQGDHEAGSSKLRTTAVTVTAANLILSSVAPILKGGQKIDEGSIVGQLLGFAETQAALPEGQLRRDFAATGAVSEIDPYIQNAWRMVSNASRVDQEEVDS